MVRGVEADTPPSSTANTDERDGAGRFKPGNKVAVGNAGPSKAGQYRKAFQEAVTLEDMKAVATKVLESAKKGDIQAARFIADYTLGKPQPVEVTDDDAVENAGTVTINFVRAKPDA